VELAVFADIDEVKGKCARSLERINDTLIPQGVHLARMDYRFWGLAPAGGKIKKMVLDEKPLEEKAKEAVLKHYTLPLAAMQALCRTANLSLAILDTALVDKRLGPFARNHDGGALETKGSLPDGSPLGTYPKIMCNVTKDNLPQFGQPFRKLVKLCSTDGQDIYPNCYHHLLFGSGVWYFDLPAGLCRIDLECDWTTGWRLVHRGYTPMAYQIRPGMKLVQQVIGPDSWQASVSCQDDMFTDAEVLEDV